MATLIYIIGIVICYILIRRIRNEIIGSTWGLVAVGFFLSLFSWSMIVIIMISMVILMITDKIKNELPDWL